MEQKTGNLLGWLRRVWFIADDLLVLGGCGLILYGTHLVLPVLVWFVGGAMCITLGVLIGAGMGRG